MKIRIVLFATLLISLLGAGIASAEISTQAIKIPLLSIESANWTDEEIAYIRALNRKGSIKIATKVSDAVYLPRNDKSISGFHYSVLKEFADLAQISIDVQLVEWQDYFYKKGADLERVKSDPNYSYVPTLIENVDIYLDGITSLPWREKMFDIVKFVPSRQLIIVRKDSKQRNISDLDGRICAMVRNTSMEQNLRLISRKHNIDFTFVYTNSFENMEQLVADGQADFTVFDSDRGYAALKRHSTLTIAWPISDIQLMGWGIDKKNRVLKSILEKYIEYAQQAAILDKYWEVHYGVSFISYLRIMNIGGNPD